MGSRTARYVNFALGSWLFISAFAWLHSGPQFTNSWLVGLLAMICASAALAVPAFRYANSVLAVWLFISVFALPRISEATGWNNALVAIAMFVVSLIPGEATMAYGRRLARVSR